ncbi:CFEM domain-containing protein [Ilyonectria destructans]|nr:CFEM domain-containing protein [Ilyonectria destructans]
MRHEALVSWAQTVYSRATEDDAGSGHYEYPYSRLQHIGFFILFFFPALALLVFGLRIYGRFSTKQYGYDDLLITIAMALSIAETGCSWKSMRTAFLGVHLADIPPQADVVLGQQWNFIIQILYNPILAIVKTSVLLFLLRLGGQKKEVRYAIYGLLAFNLALMVAIFVCAIFQCSPVTYFWMRASVNPPDGTCFDTSAFYIATGALTILTDILVLILPFWIFLGLKLPLKVRAAIIGVFALGAIVTVMSILRLAWIVETSYFMDPTSPNFDPTYDIRFTYSAVETNLAIITASAPALRPLFLKWFPRFFSALKSSGQKYSNDQYGRSTGTKRSRSGTAIRSNHRNGPFPLKDIKGRSEIRGHSPTNSEEEIMTYNGILKTSEVAVHYGNRSGKEGDNIRGANDNFGSGSAVSESSSSGIMGPERDRF